MSFLVRDLNLEDRRDSYHVEDVFGFERVAFTAGFLCLSQSWLATGSSCTDGTSLFVGLTRRVKLPW